MSKPTWPQPSPSPNQPATTNIGSHHGKTPSNSNEPAPKLLIASPYTTPTHRLLLDTLDQPTQLLARALTILAPTRDDYATAPYAASFNWPAVFARLQDLCTAHGCPWRGAREFCAVVFRSRLRAGADGEWLHVLDERSHEEACASGGLLKYWFGVADWRGDNLATCIWRCRADAQRGGSGAWHRRARAAAREMYERVEFAVLQLEVDDGGREWRFT